MHPVSDDNNWMLIIVLGTFTKSGVSNFGTNLAIFITLIKIVSTSFIEHHASRSYVITHILAHRWNDQKCIYSFCFLDRYLQLQLKKMSNKFGPLNFLCLLLLLLFSFLYIFQFYQGFCTTFMGSVGKRTSTSTSPLL